MNIITAYASNNTASKQVNFYRIKLVIVRSTIISAASNTPSLVIIKISRQKISEDKEDPNNDNQSDLIVTYGESPPNNRIHFVSSTHELLIKIYIWPNQDFLKIKEFNLYKVYSLTRI